MRISKKNMISNYSLRYQLIAVLILVSIIPLIIVGIITYQKTIADVENEKKNTLIAYAEGIKNNIDLQIQSADSSLKLIQAQSDMLVILENFNRNIQMDDMSRLNAVLFTLKNMVNNSNGLYETVYITDMNGKIIADGSEYRKSYRDTSFPDMANFEILKTSEDLLVGKPVQSKATGKLLLPVTRPIRSLSGFMGTVTILFDNEKFTENLALVKPGETGSVYLINSDNIFLFHTNKQLINTESKNQFESGIERNVESGFKVTKLNGLNKAVGYSQSAITDWIVGVDVDYKEFTESSDEFRRFILIMIVVIIIIILFLSIIYSKTITNPIIKLNKGFNEVEKGRLNTQINFRASLELNDLKTGFTEMVQKLRDLINGILNASTLLGGSSEQLIATAQNALAATNQSMDMIENISSGTANQVSETLIASSNIKQMADRIVDVKDYADEIKSMSLIMQQLIEQGINCVQVLKNKSNQNYKTTILVDNVIGVLDNEIIQVDKIANTITNIAKNTNLLSLNACIEAARAGEAGAGFTVVANEIKALAEQAAAEAKEINDIIEKIHKKSSETVNRIKDVTSTAEEQNKSVEDTQLAFESIFRSVMDISTKIDNITFVLQSMDEEKDNIVQTIKQISIVSEQAAVSSLNIKQVICSQANIMEEVTRSADELFELSESLSGQVRYFEL